MHGCQVAFGILADRPQAWDDGTHALNNGL